ncbi:MAG: hypothetical protein M0Q96_05270 [Candidatus Omnitrophica bacterium]|jgi:drug/metabolite transporter (DMT)-like permease|nr:hypothetical protein [Candidatus Omnitrophota bacterium]
MQTPLFLILFLIALTSLCDTINQLFLKSTIDSLNFQPTFNILKILKFIWRLVRIPRLWIGFIFSVISLCIWLFVLSKSDLNFAFSADSMHYIFIALASGLILKEHISRLRLVGTLVIVLGIILVSL